jgi:dTDP-3,4-didehydro-2,6-dideoxy-alpha-D-glucose 3-reductase
VTSAIAGNDHDSFHRDLLSDARCRDMIATALASQDSSHQRV